MPIIDSINILSTNRYSNSIIQIIKTLDWLIPIHNIGTVIITSIVDIFIPELFTYHRTIRYPPDTRTGMSTHNCGYFS